jgi:penicillin-binding protein 1A
MGNDPKPPRTAGPSSGPPRSAGPGAGGASATRPSARLPGSTMKMAPQADKVAPSAGNRKKAPARGKPTRPAGHWTQSRWLRALKWLAISMLVGVAILSIVIAIVIAIVFWHYGRDLPDVESLRDYQPKQVTVIEDRDGQRIGELFDDDGRRTVVPYAAIPPLLIDAVIATEDENFRSHGGLDYKGMIRAFFVNLRSGESKQGASTITQQVVKTFFLTPEKSFKRKIQEVILARRVEQALSKDEILALYLNQINFGHGRYGVQEAARFYFGKDVGQLDLGQMAMLAGLPQSPSNLSPRSHPEAAKRRQIHVLNRLAETKKVSAAEAKKWIDAPLVLAETAFPGVGAAPEWVELAKKELLAGSGTAGKASLGTRGAVVRTTVDMATQRAAAEALRAGLRKLDQRRKHGQVVRSIKPDKVPLELAKLAKKHPATGPEVGDTYEALVLAVDDATKRVSVDLGEWPATLVLDGAGDERYALDKDGTRRTPSQRFAPGDIVRVEVAGAAAAKASKASERLVRVAPGPEGAVVVIDLATREVRALVGGYSNAVAAFDRATMAKRQPGSSFKPFVYGAGVAAGKYTAASIVNDAPEVFDLWKPKNYESKKFEGPVRLRYALAKSINTVAIRVCHEVGPQAVVDFAHAAGIQSDLPVVMPISLGAGEVTPLEMTNAIATLGAGGKLAAPRFILSVDGTPREAPAATQAIDPAVAYVILDMMRSVVTEGTAASAKKLGVPVAGKTGTSNDSRDNWFVGLTADYAIGVWIGNDDDSSLGSGETGGGNAVPIFAELVGAMKLPNKAFARPGKLEDVRIDKLTGLRAADGAPKDSSITEVFIVGTAPVEVAPVPGDVSADTLVTGEYGD